MTARVCKNWESMQTRAAERLSAFKIVKKILSEMFDNFGMSWYSIEKPMRQKSSLAMQCSESFWLV